MPESNPPTVTEVQEEQYALAAQMAAEGRTAVPGMTYEEGVAAALGWVLCHTDDAPIEEES